MGRLDVEYIKPEYKKLPREVFGEIAESLEGLNGRIVSQMSDGTIPPEFENKYRRVSEDLQIVSAYIRHKEKTAIGTIPLYKYEGGALIPLVDRLRRLPEDILSDMKVDIGLADKEETISPGLGIECLSELSNTISKNIINELEGPETLFPEGTSMGKDPETKEDYLLFSRTHIVSFILILHSLNKEIKDMVINNASPVLRKKYEEISRSTEEVIIPALKESLDTLTGELSIETLKKRYELLRTIGDQILEVLSDKDKDYKVETLPGKGKVLIEFKSERPETTSSAISELAKITKSSKPSQIQVSKDIWKSQIHSVGDTLSYIEDETTKKRIQALQKKGKLLAGTLEGLSGGSAQLKVFTIALARTLNEQSKYYKTEEDWSGVPKKLIPEIMGEDVEIEKKDSVIIRNEKRPYPYILVSYEDMARKMSKNGKISGGKDIEYIKDYIEELSGKEYLLDRGGNQIIGVRFLNKIMTIYTKDRGTEVGCLLQLSPQFSRSMGGYTGLRSDTIQLLGGGKQKDITMDLFDLLIYYRGIPGGVYRVPKKLLLSRYESKPTYLDRGSIRRVKLEKDFQDSIEKIKGAKVITKYKEEKKPGGEVVSVFFFSKEEYLAGDDIEGQ